MCGGCVWCECVFECVCVVAVCGVSVCRVCMCGGCVWCLSVCAECVVCGV